MNDLYIIPYNNNTKQFIVGIDGNNERWAYHNINEFRILGLGICICCLGINNIIQYTHTSGYDEIEYLGH